MAQDTAKKTTAKKAKAPAAGAHATAPGKKGAAGKRAAAKSGVAKAAALSEDVLKSVEAGQRAAIDAVRKFVDTVDEALPAIGGRPSHREAIIDAALKMADKLVTTQYDFLRSVVQSADRSLSKSDAKKASDAEKP